MTERRPWIRFVEAVGVTTDGEVFIPQVEPLNGEDTSPDDGVRESDSTMDG